MIFPPAFPGLGGNPAARPMAVVDKCPPVPEVGQGAQCDAPAHLAHARLLQDVRRAARQPPRRPDGRPSAAWASCNTFVKLFAVSARLTKAVRRHGATGEAWDIVFDPAFDFTVENNIQQLLRRLRRGTIHALWLGTECRTFSSARRPPLRSSAHPNGPHGLTGRDLAACLHGNSLAETSARIITVAASLGTPIAVENPHRSLLWHHSAFQELAARWPPQKTSLDYCCFGTPWRKRTAF